MTSFPREPSVRVRVIRMPLMVDVDVLIGVRDVVGAVLPPPPVRSVSNFLLVAGPVTPYPVVSGVPEVTMLYFTWNARSPTSVFNPKNPVAESAGRSPSLIKIC